MGKDSVDKMVDILKDPERLRAVVANPNTELPKVAAEAKGVPNTPIYWIISIALAVVAVCAVLGVIGLVAVNKNTGLDVIIGLGSTAVGALAGALVTPKQ